MTPQNAVFAMVLFITSLLMLLWYNSGQSSINPAPLSATDNSPDFFLSNFVIEDYSDTGKLSYSIRAKNLEHYPVTDTATVTSPLITLYPEGRNSNWFAEATTAQIEKEGNLLTLENNVKLFNDKAVANRVTVSTDKLIINIDEKLAYTDSKVFVKNAHGNLESVGIEANLLSNTVKLQSRVRGFHTPLPK